MKELALRKEAAKLFGKLGYVVVRGGELVPTDLVLLWGDRYSGMVEWWLCDVITSDDEKKGAERIVEVYNEGYKKYGDRYMVALKLNGDWYWCVDLGDGVNCWSLCRNRWEYERKDWFLDMVVKTIEE